MGSSQMATTSKKGGSISSTMGRPLKGALSSFDATLRERIKTIRIKHEGWGADSIIDELENEYDRKDLPSIDSINRYLRQEQLVTPNQVHGVFPKQKCLDPLVPHDLWEMDAQGAIPVLGIGHQAIINMKDSCSKAHCMAFPIAVQHQRGQPSKRHYQWALRFAFEEIGRPLAIQVDKDSVFYENNTRSPYPVTLHLWLVGLGIRMCHIEVPPPQKQAIVERSHQTMEKQAVKGQTFGHWKQFFEHCNKRRQRLNYKLPNRSLDRKPPFAVFPQAIHSGRNFSIKQEYELLDLQKIYDFLSLGKWFRIVSSCKMVSLGGKRYFLANAQPKTQVQITFDPVLQKFFFRDVNEQILAELPPKGISKEDLMGGLTTNEVLILKKKILKSKDFSL
jgi:hypothetical protein